jgi:hypothetical protein
MRSKFIEIAEAVLIQNIRQMALAKNDDVIQTLAPCAPKKAFAPGQGPRSSAELLLRRRSVNLARSSIGTIQGFQTPSSCQPTPRSPTNFAVAHPITTRLPNESSLGLLSNDHVTRRMRGQVSPVGGEQHQLKRVSVFS